MSIDYSARRRSSPLTVLYDADCGWCSAVARRLRRLDRGSRLRFVPLQAAERSPDAGVAMLARRRDLAATLHVVDASGAWTSGGAAVLWILESLPPLRPLARLARLPIVGRLIEPAYRVVADHRGRLSRLLGAACRVPGAGPRGGAT
jgi:predicted DCC family thiol-disulfide oxidoreductase YuxK